MTGDEQQPGRVAYLPARQLTGHDLAAYDPYSQARLPDREFDLRELWNTIVKYRFTILIFLSVIVVTTAVATLLMRPVYRASVLVEINPEARGPVKFQTVEQGKNSPKEYLTTQENILRSQSVTRAVIKDLSLAEHPEIGGDESQRGLINGLRSAWATLRGTQSQATGQSRDQQLVQRFSEKLEVQPIRRSNLFRVSFDSFDPELAASAANAVVAAYIRLNEERRLGSTSGAKGFLDKEIKRLQARLERSERDLNEFARKHEVVDVEEKSNIMNSRLVELSAEFTRVQGQRVAAETLFEQAAKGNVDSLPKILDEELIRTLKGEQTRLQGEYFRMSRIYKEAYPKLQQVKAQLQQVEASLKRETQRLVESLRLEYEQLLSKEQLLGKLLEKHKLAILDLRDRSVQYNILKREWESNKQLYSGLLDRMKEVGVSAGIEINNISVVDPAMVPVLPYRPSLGLNVSLALVFGLFGGVGLAFLLAYLDNTVRTPEEIEKL
ncbi:MAG: GumC family protein, partial [Gammaproteobacteria bacterium]|nr:GumC family protein [Gammaproteobacteria bacterium]